ncbi:MAG: hypothetical protein HC775_13035 [Hyellaceae cyanobacterium CSU_1_1]|nr:hypothetical protein [Pleurocapsa sp. CRU_1_2]NJR46619.1 hypothetical protein [Hyellaceae cyanobacterium CSU_1_1]
MRGGSGNDQLIGGEGTDSLLGESGNDTLFGSSGNDTLTGSAGDDVLQGGNGADRIEGGSGNNIVYGGADADTFVLINAGLSNVQDFVDGTDKITLGSGLTFADLTIQDNGGDTEILNTNNDVIGLLVDIADTNITAADFV